MPSLGSLSLLLHAHLPFVRHPEHPDFLEEDWLYEAITETYLPLARMMERLESDKVDFRLALSITPPLCEMLADPLLQTRYVARLEALVELALRQEREQRGTKFEAATAMYARELREAHRVYTGVWKRDILSVFRRFNETANLELVGSAATHAILPLLATDEGRWAQIAIGMTNHEKHFGVRPRGLWMPECAFAPGLERLLADAGVRWSTVEAHGLQLGTPRPRFGTARPVFTTGGVAMFGRDPESSREVWSSEEGYPGDPLYREFYRDLGWDLPREQLGSLLHTDGLRRAVGLKLHRVTGRVPLDEKEPYVPEWATERASVHAGNFLYKRQHQMRALRSSLGVDPHIIAPYDAELFGHWWYEGPQFLEMLLRRLAAPGSDVRAANPGELIVDAPVHQVVTPALSSWGDKGYFEVWVNSANDWIYKHLHRAEERMVHLAERFPDAEGVERRALDQAARELLLAQSSDWAFIMTSRTTVPYAERRTKEHVARFTALSEQLLAGSVDVAALVDLESKDSCFSEMDYRVFHPGRVWSRGTGTAVATSL